MGAESAEQPVSDSGVVQKAVAAIEQKIACAESAAQPASGTGERFDELQTWFDSLGEDVGQHQAEISSLRHAYELCRNNATKKALRELSKEWNLTVYKNRKDLSVPEMLAQLQAAI